MAISARVPSGAETYYFVPIIYSQKVIDDAKSNLVAWDAIDSSWETELKKGMTLNIPVINAVTATEVTVGTKAASLNPFASTGVQLVIDQWYESPIDIDTMTSHQTQQSMEEQAKTASAYAIKKRIDTTVCAKFSSLGGYSASAYGTDGQTLTDDILLYLMEKLNENDVPMDNDRFLVLDPSGLTDMLKIDKFIAAQYVNIGAVTNGNVGKSPIYGCNVKVTNNLSAATTGAYGVMMHRKAIAGASQIYNAWMKPFEELHNIRYSVDALWGVVEARDTFGVPFYTRKS
jgi:hypothetical protein